MKSSTKIPCDRYVKVHVTVEVVWIPPLNPEGGDRANLIYADQAYIVAHDKAYIVAHDQAYIVAHESTITAFSG